VELLILALLIAAGVFFVVAGVQSGWPTRWACWGLALLDLAFILERLPGG